MLDAALRERAAAVSLDLDDLGPTDAYYLDLAECTDAMPPVRKLALPARFGTSPEARIRHGAVRECDAGRRAPDFATSPTRGKRKRTGARACPSNRERHWCATSCRACASRRSAAVRRRLVARRPHAPRPRRRCVGLVRWRWRESAFRPSRDRNPARGSGNAARGLAPVLRRGTTAGAERGSGPPCRS